MKERDCMEKATNLSEVRVNCQYYALDRDERQKFYVDTSEARGVDVLERLINDFEYVPNMYQQVLFLGHIGTGKSTLLYQLERNLRGTYKVIRFSVQEYLDMEKITFVDLLCVMYERILTVCSDDLGDNSSILKSIYDKWSVTTKVEVEKEKDYNMKVAGDVEIGIKSALIKLMSTLTSTLKVGTKEREIICSIVENNVHDYINLLNQLVEVVNKNSSIPILLIFEELEKISPKDADSIFIRNGSYFKQIKLHLLLTTPIFLKYNSCFKNIISQHFTFNERCPIIAVSTADGNDFETGINKMCEIVNARVNRGLIEDTALRNAAIYSGGVIRDLLWMIGEAARICKTGCVKIEDVENAFSDLQTLYGDGLRQNQVDIIKRVYANPYCLVDKNEELELMQAEVIIEYNGKQWRGIHPAVVKYLSDRGLLTD